MLFKTIKNYLKFINILSNLPAPMYQIKSIDNPEEDVIKGQFYGHELTLTSKEYAKINRG